MRENQHIEWKESWKNDYLRWICGFANAEGGTLVIGRNDKGEVVGIKEARKLMEEIPNKVRDILGIMVDVNLKKKGGAEYLEIVVDPYTNPVSYKGEYHYRSGSTKQELKGAALDRFLLRKHGLHWDGIPIPKVTEKDLSKPAIAAFRKLAKSSKRLATALLSESTHELIEKLQLIDGTRLKRAAVLLFHAEPERFFTGSFIKIGYFQTDSELLYHDEIHGDLFTQAQKTVDLLLTKYLKAAISYRGLQRIESLPVPENALREVLLNAIIHRDYSVASPIQIRIYGDRLKIWNPCQLPESWSIEKLMKEHSSRPFNPAIANVFFRAGEIEAWGRGIQRIFDECREAGSPQPRIDYSPGDLWIEFPFPASYLKIIPTRIPTEEGIEKKSEPREKTREKTREKILHYLRAHPKSSMAELSEYAGISGKGIEWQIQKLKQEKFISRIGSDKGGYWEVLK